MKASAKRTVMMIDSTKFGVCSSLTSFQLKEVDAVITDDAAPADIVEQIVNAGVEVHTVPSK